MRWIAGLLLLTALSLALAGGGAPREERERAVMRGLDFLYAFARRPAAFREWGHDMLSAFYNIAVTSRRPGLRRRAWYMGHERALAWRQEHAGVAPGSSAEDMAVLVMGNDAAGRLGVPDPRLTAELRRAAARFSAVDYYGFDPNREPPPTDLPEPCSKCGHQEPRGTTVCTRCGTKLKFYDRYDLYQDALIGTYSGDLAGITLGARYADVARWLPAMRPWPIRRPGDERHYYAGVYAVTHAVYTANGYSQFLLSPECFPEEFAYLKNNLTQAVADHDPETMGEYLDTLRAFGLTSRDPLIRAGFDYLLSAQNPDGSWGDPSDPDPYGRYHPTWTAVDGLRDYRWERVLPCRR